MPWLSKDQFKSYHSQMMAQPGEEGGFSVHAVTGEEPTEGSMVSWPGELRTKPAAASQPSSLPHFVRQHKADFQRPDVYLGGWKPETDAFTTVDKAQNVTPDRDVTEKYGRDVAEVDALEKALTLGIAHDQDAVYNLKRGRSIDTGLR